jgi:hypothetical protein
MKGLLSIKLQDRDPSQGMLDEISVDINEFLGSRISITNGRVDGKYVYYDYEDNLAQIPEYSLFVQGLISGYLMASGFNVI